MAYPWVMSHGVPLDHESWLKLRQAARDWAASTGDELCLACLEHLEAARSAGLDANAGIDPDGLDYRTYWHAGGVAVLLATEPSLDPSLPIAIAAMDKPGRPWLHIAVGYRHSDTLTTLLASPGGKNDGGRGVGWGSLGRPMGQLGV